MPLTAAELISNLRDDVQGLVDGGVLTQNQADGLIDRLNAVPAKVIKGQVQPAIDQLGSFMDQVRDFIAAGKLTAAQGQQLIDAVQAIIDSLGISTRLVRAPGVMRVRYQSSAAVAPVAPCTGRHPLAEVTEENLPPAPSARDIGLHRLGRDPAGSEIVWRLRHLCLPRVQGHGFCQAQVLREP